MGIGRLLLFSALALLGWTSPSQGGAQGVLLRGEAVVRLSPDPGPIPVTVHFVLRPEGKGEVPLSLLAPAGVSIDLLEATRLLGDNDPSAADTLSIRLEELRDQYWEGILRLPVAGGQLSDSTVVRLSYVVNGAWAVPDDNLTSGGLGWTAARVTIPLVVPRWLPAEPEPTTFRAQMLVPGGITVTSSFPSSVVSRPEPGQPGVLKAVLQGPPAMLILRLTQGRGSRVTLERSLDLMVILVVLVMGIFGVRYLRRAGR